MIVLILYVVLSYLFMVGTKMEEPGTPGVMILLSPFTMPMLLGSLFVKAVNKYID